MKDHHYFVYIITNPKKTVLYSGITNDFERRMLEHYENRGKKELLQESTFVISLSILKLSTISGKPLKGKKKSRT